MNIQTKLYYFKLPFVKDLNLKNKIYTHRKGFILAFYNDNEILALGEISPLPGFSKETTEQSEQQIKQFFKNISLHEVLVNLQDSQSIENLFEYLNDANLYPSVGFGISTAILNLLSKLKNTTFRNIISQNASDNININALLTGNENEIIEKIMDFKNKGFKAFKLKVGRQNIEEDINLIHKVYEFLGETASLVLDVNRAWSIESAVYFAENIKGIKVKYIEEPVNDFLGILQLCNRGEFNIPIALDESLCAISPNAMEQIPGISTLILKPTIIGFLKTLEFNQKAKSLGMATVISSSFESSIGLVTLAELAGGLKASAGLDTWGWFAGDTLEPSFETKSGTLNLKTLSEQKMIFNFSYLKEIDLD